MATEISFHSTIWPHVDARVAYSSRPAPFRFVSRYRQFPEPHRSQSLCVTIHIEPHPPLPLPAVQHDSLGNTLG